MKDETRIKNIYKNERLIKKNLLMTESQMVNSWQKKMKSLSPNQFENQEPMKDREAMSDYDSDGPDTICQKIAISINKKTIKIAISWEEKKPKLK